MPDRVKPVKRENLFLIVKVTYTSHLYESLHANHLCEIWVEAISHPYSKLLPLIDNLDFVSESRGDIWGGPHLASGC